MQGEGHVHLPTGRLARIRRHVRLPEDHEHHDPRHPQLHERQADREGCGGLGPTRRAVMGDMGTAGIWQGNIQGGALEPIWRHPERDRGIYPSAKAPEPLRA